MFRPFGGSSKDWASGSLVSNVFNLGAIYCYFYYIKSE